MEYRYRTNRFSLTDSQMRVLTGILEKYRPENICELGAGVSTDFFDQMEYL